MQNYSELLTHLTFNLSSEVSLKGLFHQHLDGNPLPSYHAIREITELSRCILFPGYFGNSSINRHTVRYHIGVEVEKLFNLLSEQIIAAVCFDSADDLSHIRNTMSRNPNSKVVEKLSELSKRSKDQATTASTYRPIINKNILDSLDEDERFKELAHLQNQTFNKHSTEIYAISEKSKLLTEKEKASSTQDLNNHTNQVNDHEQGIQSICCNDYMKEYANDLAVQFIASLMEIREMLAEDVQAAFESDPAANSFGEVITCYPGLRAICNYRIAHQLLTQGVPLIPRAITELAHSETGIDIHPGAQIGRRFTIDHGTGVVIGETCIIGNNVQLYQGVTLGAKSIPVDDKGAPLNVPRHPILEDNVVVYSNATILGRITIGDGAIIGGNVWVTEDVKPNTKIVQQKAKR